VSLIELVYNHIRRQKRLQQRLFAGEPIAPGALMVPMRMTMANLRQMNEAEIVEWAYRIVESADVERKLRGGSTT
jgi:hypothetical protein